MGEEAIRRSESDAPLQPPPVQRISMDTDSYQGPGRAQKGCGLCQLTIEEMGLGSKGPRVLEHSTCTHRSNALRSNEPRVLKHATASDQMTERRPSDQMTDRSVCTDHATERRPSDQTIAQ